jgi:hypothetical protein
VVREFAGQIFMIGDGRDGGRTNANGAGMSTGAVGLERIVLVRHGYQIEGVPTLAVNGKYATSPEMVKGKAKALYVVDELIMLARPQSGVHHPSGIGQSRRKFPSLTTVGVRVACCEPWHPSVGM